MKYIGITTFLVVLLLPTQSVAVGFAKHFKVDYVRVDKSGKGYIQFKSALIGTSSGGPASCTTTYVKALAFDTNTAGGQAILSAALSAQARDTTMYAIGTGKCDIYGVMEDYSWGYTK